MHLMILADNYWCVSGKEVVQACFDPT